MLNPPCTLYKFLTVNAAMPVIQASRTFIFHSEIRNITFIGFMLKKGLEPLEDDICGSETRCHKIRTELIDFWLVQLRTEWQLWPKVLPHKATQTVWCRGADGWRGGFKVHDYPAKTECLAVGWVLPQRVPEGGGWILSAVFKEFRTNQWSCFSNKCQK